MTIPRCSKCKILINYLVQRSIGDRLAGEEKRQRVLFADSSGLSHQWVALRDSA